MSDPQVIEVVAWTVIGFAIVCVVVFSYWDYERIAKKLF